MISRLAAAGELLTDPPSDPEERDRQIARVVARFPFTIRAPDWLAFLRDYGGLTYVREGFSTGFFGVSYNASVHILDGEGDPIANGCLLICDAAPPILGGNAGSGGAGSGRAGSGRAGSGRAGSGRAGSGRAGSGGAGSGYAAFGFDATGERRWGVYGVTEGGDIHWYAPTFTEWLESFADAIT